MRNLWIAAAAGALLAGPASAQSLNDAGQLLQRILPGQQQQQPGPAQSDRDRAIYEQGRRDAADEARRRDGQDRYGQQRGDDRRRAEDRPRNDPRNDPSDNRDRRRGGPDRSYDDADRPPPPGRYQPFDNR